MGDRVVDMDALCSSSVQTSATAYTIQSVTAAAQSSRLMDFDNHVLELILASVLANVAETLAVECAFQASIATGTPHLEQILPSEASAHQKLCTYHAVTYLSIV